MFLRLGVSNSYVWGLVFLLLGLEILTFGAKCSFFWVLGILTFEGLRILTFGG